MLQQRKVNSQCVTLSWAMWDPSLRNREFPRGMNGYDLHITRTRYRICLQVSQKSNCSLHFCCQYCVFMLTFNFEIIMGPQKLQSHAQGCPVCPSPSLLQWKQLLQLSYNITTIKLHTRACESGRIWIHFKCTIQ